MSFYRLWRNKKLQKNNNMKTERYVACRLTPTKIRTRFTLKSVNLCLS